MLWFKDLLSQSGDTKESLQWENSRTMHKFSVDQSLYSHLKLRENVFQHWEQGRKAGLFGVLYSQEKNMPKYIIDVRKPKIPV